MSNVSAVVPVEVARSEERFPLLLLVTDRVVEVLHTLRIRVLEKVVGQKQTSFVDVFTLRFKEDCRCRA